MDEPCFGLVELDLLRPDSHGYNRYQILYVVRRDRLAEYREDLGVRERWDADNFRIPGGVHWANGTMEILHTVGELRDIADVLRGRPRFHPDPPRQALGERLVEALHNHTAASVFGPHFKKER